MYEIVLCWSIVYAHAVERHLSNTRKMLLFVGAPSLNQLPDTPAHLPMNLGIFKEIMRDSTARYVEPAQPFKSPPLITSPVNILPGHVCI